MYLDVHVTEKASLLIYFLLRIFRQILSIE